jgi:hypothetical protein
MYTIDILSKSYTIIHHCYKTSDGDEQWFSKSINLEVDIISIPNGCLKKSKYVTNTNRCRKYLVVAKVDKVTNHLRIKSCVIIPFELPLDEGRRIWIQNVTARRLRHTLLRHHFIDSLTVCDNDGFIEVSRVRWSLSAAWGKFNIRCVQGFHWLPYLHNWMSRLTLIYFDWQVGIKSRSFVLII